MIAMTAHCDLDTCDSNGLTDPEGMDLPVGWLSVSEVGETGGKRDETEKTFCSREHARAWLNGRQ